MMLKLIELYGDHISSFAVNGHKGGATPILTVPFGYAGVGLMLRQFPVGCIWLYYIHINEHEGLVTVYIQGLWLWLSW